MTRQSKSSHSTMGRGATRSDPGHDNADANRRQIYRRALLRSLLVLDGLRFIILVPSSGVDVRIGGNKIVATLRKDGVTSWIKESGLEDGGARGCRYAKQDEVA